MKPFDRSQTELRLLSFAAFREHELRRNRREWWS